MPTTIHDMSSSKLSNGDALYFGSDIVTAGAYAKIDRDVVIPRLDILLPSTGMLILPYQDDGGIVQIGNGTADIDVKIFLGDTSHYVEFNVGTQTMTIATALTISADVTLTGDLTLTLEDINIYDGHKLEFGTGKDFVMEWGGVFMACTMVDSGKRIEWGANASGYDNCWFGDSTKPNQIMKWDASVAELVLDLCDIHLGDGDTLKFGDLAAGDFTIQWTDTFAAFTMSEAGKRLQFGANASGFDVQLYGDSTKPNKYLQWDASEATLLLTDSTYVKFGDAGDITIRWDGAAFLIRPIADDTLIEIGSGTLNCDVKVYGETAAAYMGWDASENKLTLAGGATLVGAQVDSTKVLYVDVGQTGSSETGNRGDPYKTIGAAVAAVIATGLNSDLVAHVIMIAPGTYTETLTLENAALYNIAFISTGGPAKDGYTNGSGAVIMDPASNPCVESEASNTNLHYLYFYGIYFKGNITIDGTANDSLLGEKGIVFENCGMDDGNTACTLSVKCVEKFSWRNCFMNRKSVLIVENAWVFEICGEGHSDWPMNMGGDSTLTADTGQACPYHMRDAHQGGDQMTFKVDHAFCQRNKWILAQGGAGKLFINCTHGLFSTGSGMTLPYLGVLYGYMGIFIGNITMNVDSTLFLYNTVVKDTLTRNGCAANIYNNVES